MNTTKEVIAKHCYRNKQHIHHPFRFYCIYCHFDAYCIICDEYEHDFCETCYHEVSDKAKDMVKTARLIKSLIK